VSQLKTNILPSVVVVQTGARHNYAIARMLRQRGALLGLITDFGWSGESKYGPALKVLGKQVSEVERRRIPELSIAQINAIWGASVLSVSSRVFGKAMDKFAERWFDARCGHLWLDKANVIYSVPLRTEGEYLNRARRSGVRVASEVFITPIAHRIVAEEQRAYPGWEDHGQEKVASETMDAHIIRVIQQSDLLVCPSQFVIDGLRCYGEFDERKSVIVPYGNAAGRRPSPRPEKGRVLFAGTASLRKGIHYLALAARILSSQAPQFKIYVAGGVSPALPLKSECKYLHFLGQLSAAQMAAEFNRADIFVLPTLAEGSASVINEALASSVPVVTTLAAGSIVRNEVEGLIVPERDAEAIVQAILRIGLDRKLRESMSSCAARAIGARNQKRWGDEILEALTRLVDRQDMNQAPRA
jgi:glycosyltransferase involved in cell wall biosynthesis